MDLKKRLFRRPVTTVIWLVVLSLMASMLGVGANLLYSSQMLRENLDSHHTTIGIPLSRPVEKDWGLEYEYPVLFPEHLETLESMDTVEMVDLRTLTGAYIPELTSQLGLTKWGTLNAQDWDYVNHTTNESYNQVVLAGTIEESWVFYEPEEYINHYDLTAMGMGKDERTHYEIAVLNIEEIVVAHPDYDFYATEEFSSYCGKVYVQVDLFEESGEAYFQPGQRYIVTGWYDPSCHGIGYETFQTPDGIFYPWVKINGGRYLESSPGMVEGDKLNFYRDAAETMIDWDTRVFTHDVMKDPVPVAQRLTGSVEELLESDAQWKESITFFAAAEHTFPVLGTECLETMHSFLTNAASITSGRTFTQKEYDTGAKVCVISESVALTGDIQVGDTISLQQHLVDMRRNTNRSLDDMKETLNNPAVGRSDYPFQLGETEEFTVVGIYRLERSWDDSTFSITPNTVFMPQKAQIPGGFGGLSHYEEVTYTALFTDLETGEQWTGEKTRKDLHTGGTYGVFMSVKLKNGTMEEFQEELKQAGIVDEYITVDQGYEAAQESLEAVAAQARKLFAIAAVSWVLLLILYILLYQSKQKRNLGIMRSLGAKPNAARRYLVFSGLVLAVAGVAIGTLVCGRITAGVSKQLAEFVFSAETMLSHSGGQELTTEAVSSMIAGSQIPAKEMLLLAAAQILIMWILLWIHGVILAAKKPRKLLGK